MNKLPESMICPGCGAAMADGLAEVRSGFWDYIFFGLSSQHLWFLSRQGRQKFLCSGGTAPAFSCSACGLLVLQRERTRKERFAEAKSEIAEYLDSRKPE